MGPGQEDIEEWGGLLLRKMARRRRAGYTRSFYVFTEELTSSAGGTRLALIDLVGRRLHKESAYQEPKVEKLIQREMEGRPNERKTGWSF